MKKSKKQPYIDLVVFISIFGDVLFILIGILYGFWLKFSSGMIPFGIEDNLVTLKSYLGLIFIGSFFLISTFAYLGIYDSREILNIGTTNLIIIKGTAFWFIAYLGISLVLKFEPPISRIFVISSYFCCLILLLLWRFTLARIIRSKKYVEEFRQKTLLIGWNKEAQKILEIVNNDRHRTMEITAILLTSDLFKFERKFESEHKNIIIYKPKKSLQEVIKNSHIDTVVLTDLNTSTDDILNIVNDCERNLLNFKVVPSYFQILISGLKLESMSGVPMLGISELPLDRSLNRIIKRIVDIIGACVGLFISIPIFIICGILIYIESPGSIFYRQIRTGKNGVEFKIIKLRSMKINAEETGAQWAQKNDPRRLRIGAFMREWNLDETPQFWNVLKGEMSLVGPRPERPELIENFKENVPHYMARLASKPGITGWAQVNGLRGDTSLIDRVRYDLYYLENWSIWMDVQIMVLTFFKRENAY